jgi:hypothetical protein
LNLFHSLLEQVIDGNTKKLKTRGEIERIADRSKIDPIINQCLDDMDAEKEYQDYMKKYGSQGGNPDQEEKGDTRGPNLGGPGGFDFNLN